MYNNPWNITAILMTGVAALLLLISVFLSDVEGAVSKPFMIAPSVGCQYYETEEDFNDILTHLYNQEERKILEVEEDSGGYDFFMISIYDTGDQKTIQEHRFRDGLMCAKLIPLKEEQGNEL